MTMLNNKLNRTERNYMKRIIGLALAGFILLSACSKSEPEVKAPYEAGSAEYTFFQTLADSLPILNPGQKVDLVKTDDFTITNFQIMPMVYRALNGDLDNMKNVKMSQLMEFITQIAGQEAGQGLLENAATEAGVTVLDSTIDAEMEKIFASYHGKESFLSMLSEQGFDENYVRNDIKKVLKINDYLQNHVFDLPEIDPAEVTAMQNTDQTATVRHILMLTQGKSDADKAEIKNKMKGLLKRAKAGEDFAELAKEYSEDPGSKDNGGLYESFARGRMFPEFDAASFSLPVGSISDIIETQYGFHILKVIDRQKDTRSFDEIKTDLQMERSKEGNQEKSEKLLVDLKDKKHFEVLF